MISKLVSKQSFSHLSLFKADFIFGSHWKIIIIISYYYFRENCWRQWLYTYMDFPQGECLCEEKLSTLKKSLFRILLKSTKDLFKLWGKLKSAFVPHNHYSSEIRGLCLMKWSSKMIWNLQYFRNVKNHKGKNRTNWKNNFHIAKFR